MYLGNYKNLLVRLMEKKDNVPHVSNLLYQVKTLVA